MQVEPSTCFEAVNLSDVGVVQRRQDLCFALEAGQPVGVVGKMVRQQLQRDVSLQPRVAAAKHHAHAAFAERRRDFVGTDARARANRHLDGDYSEGLQAPGSRLAPLASREDSTAIREPFSDSIYRIVGLARDLHL